MPQIGSHLQFRIGSHSFLSIYYNTLGLYMEARAGIEPAYTDLQSAASPLRHRAPRKRLEGAQMGKQQQSVKRNRAFVERGGEYAWPKRTIPIEGSVDAAVLLI